MKLVKFVLLVIFLVATVSFSEYYYLKHKDKNSLVVLDTPKIGQTISTPLMISGRARGTWFFEASFPIVLQDANGKVIATDHATAKSDWMTTDFVPFEALIDFEKPQTKTGLLILKKDNPSGDPSHDDQVTVPVSFE